LSAGAVAAVYGQLDNARRLAEKMHSAFRLFRWHEPLEDGTAASNVVPFKPVVVPAFKCQVYPDLAAFTAHSVHQASQDEDGDLLTEGWFADKSLFYIRGDNLGFSLPDGSIAIVESAPYEGKDHNIVIARLPNTILARPTVPAAEGRTTLSGSGSPGPASIQAHLDGGQQHGRRPQDRWDADGTACPSR
jgi:hypothetical protein